MPLEGVIGLSKLCLNGLGGGVVERGGFIVSKSCWSTVAWFSGVNDENNVSIVSGGRFESDISKNSVEMNVLLE